MKLFDRFVPSAAVFFCLLIVYAFFNFFLAVVSPNEISLSVGVTISLLAAILVFVYPKLVSRKFSKVILMLVGLYLIPGALMSTAYLIDESHVYVCGEVTRSGDGFKNPDPSRCHPRINEPWVWSSAAASLLYWPFMVLGAISG